MTKDEALKLALEALETLMIERGSIYDKAIIAIRKALANEALDKKAENARELGLDYEPQRKPLTEKQIKEALSDMSALQMPINKLIPAMARAIEAAHGIKVEA